MKSKLKKSIKLSKLSLGFKQFLVKTGVFGGVGGEERKKN